jgi:(R,R)-butanediol dehydrogenase/meso-butanediol dehydrogenase/diacetyl reductase
MKAAVFHGQRDIRLAELATPEPADGELLLCIAAVGICGTDAGEYAHGPSMFPIEHRHPITGHCGPMVPGHEFSGHVVAVGPNVNGFAEGDLVTSGAGISCGSCRQCRLGRNNLCERYATVGLQRNGGLAEFTTVPASACLNVERRPLTSDVAAMAQPMSIAVHALRRGRPEPGDEVVVLGAGGIGAFLIHAAAKHGARVTAIDLDAERLAIALRLGATQTIQATRAEPLLDQLAALASAPQIVYECTGVASGVEAAVGTVERGGRVVVVGLHKAPVPVNLTTVALQEKELIGTLAHVFDADFGLAVDLLEDETDLWAQVAPTVIPLDDLVEIGLRPMIEGGAAPIKALLDPRLDAPRDIRTS